MYSVDIPITITHQVFTSSSTNSGSTPFSVLERNVASFAVLAHTIQKYINNVHVATLLHVCIQLTETPTVKKAQKHD